MEHQDWTPVVVRARRGGAAAAAEKQARPAVSAAAAQARRVENDELPKPKMLSAASRQLMIQARVAHGMNQTQLNQACSFPAHSIRDIESGKTHPTPAQLNTINVVLKVAMKYE
jgi:ribosome-binding protein aMBF1 (putative translation factor)